MALFEYISLTYYYYGPFTSQTLVRGAWCKSKICTIFFFRVPLETWEKKKSTHLYNEICINHVENHVTSNFTKKWGDSFFKAPPHQKLQAPCWNHSGSSSPPIMLVNSPYFMFVMNDTISIHPIIIIDLQIYFKPPKRLHWLTAHGHITSRDNKDIIWYNLKQSQVYSILFSSIHKWTYTHIM